MVDDGGLDHASTDGIRDMQAEHQERDEVEECGPGHRIVRAQHSRRHDGRNRVGGIVESVQEIERERYRDQKHDCAEAETGGIHRFRAPRRFPG